jgi:hypothetical protein
MTEPAQVFFWAGVISFTVSVMSKLGPVGRRVSPWLAAKFGRLLLTVGGQPVKWFGGENPPYEMLQAWISNQWREDAIDVRCELRWRPMGKHAVIAADTLGAWCPS